MLEKIKILQSKVEQMTKNKITILKSNNNSEFNS